MKKEETREELVALLMRASLDIMNFQVQISKYKSDIAELELTIFLATAKSNLFR